MGGHPPNPGPRGGGGRGTRYRVVAFPSDAAQGVSYIEFSSVRVTPLCAGPPSDWGRPLMRHRELHDYRTVRSLDGTEMRERGAAMSRTRGRRSVPWILRSVQRGDDDGLLELYSEVFSGESARSAAHWRWKYLDPRVANHSCVAQDPEDGRFVAHIGGLALPTWCRGEVRTTTQSVDNMLAPRLQQGLKRIGVFALAVNHWVDSWFGAERDFIAWGYPSEGNFRIGQRFCKYSLVRPINVLLCESGSLPAVSGSSLEVIETRVLGPEINRLWERCAPSMEMGLVRNRAYLDWRYRAHPDVDYRVLVAQDSGSGGLRGLCVMRDGGIDPGAATIMDWLVPSDDEEAACSLLGEVGRRAQAAGQGTVGAFFPDGLHWFQRFQEYGFRVRATEAIQVARSWDRAVSLRDIRRGFYATFGDMDVY